MPQINQSFGGATLIVPGVYYKDNVNAVLPANTFPGLPLIFIGVGYGGVPNTPYAFSDANSLKAFMRGSSSARFVDFMTNPSSEVPGAQNFVYINPAPNVQATATLLSSAATAVINMAAVNYGAPGNAMTYQVAAGSQAGINLTIADPNYTGLSFTGVNLGVPFQLTYTGTSSAAQYAVIASGGKATSFVISGANAGENVNYDLTNTAYATIGQLLSALNGTGAYTALLLSNASLPTSALDAHAASALATGTAVNVTATLGDVNWWINNVATQLASSSIASGVSASSAPGLIPAVVGPNTFSGGQNVNPSNTNYASAFNTALNVQGWVVFADSNTSGIQALGQAHVNTASSISSKHWRRFVTGSNLGDSTSVAVSAARALNSINCTFCYPGIMAVDPTTGNTVTYSGLYTAAEVAGMMAGGPIALPLTNKSINAVGVEVLLQTSDINTLQQGGVLPVYISPSTQVPTIVSDLTAWQNDNNPENVFNQQVACRYALAYTLTQNIQPYVGQIASTQSLTRVQNAVVRSLNASLYNDASQGGFLNSWDPSTLVLTYDGTTQTLSVSVSVVFVGQYRFIDFTVSVQPLNLTATGA